MPRGFGALMERVPLARSTAVFVRRVDVFWPVPIARIHRHHGVGAVTGDDVHRALAHLDRQDDGLVGLEGRHVRS